MLLKRISLLWGDHHQRPSRFHRLARHGGVAQVNVLLRNFLLGFYGFAAFCFTLAVALPAMATAVAFSLAMAVALAVQGGDLLPVHAPPARPLDRLTKHPSHRRISWDRSAPRSTRGA